MKELCKDPSREEIITAVNHLLGICNALSKTITHISDNNKSNHFAQQIVDLEKKIIAQGDLIVNYLGSKSD